MRPLLFMLAGGCMVVEEVTVVALEGPSFPPAGRPVAGLSVGLTASGRVFYFRLWNVSGRSLSVSRDPRLFTSSRLEVSRLREGEREVLRSPRAPVEADPRCSYVLPPNAALVRPVELDLALARGEYRVAWVYWVTGKGVWTGVARSNALTIRVHGGR